MDTPGVELVSRRWSVEIAMEDEKEEDQDTSTTEARTGERPEAETESSLWRIKCHIIRRNKEAMSQLRTVQTVESAPFSFSVARSVQSNNNLQ